MPILLTLVVLDGEHLTFGMGSRIDPACGHMGPGTPGAICVQRPGAHKFPERREDMRRAMGYAKGVVRPGFAIVLCRHVSNLTLPGTHLPEPFI